MRRQFYLAVILLFGFFAPVNGVSVDHQEMIFNYLEAGLDIKDETNYLGENDYKSLQQYLAAVRTNQDFKAYAQKQGWNLKLKTQDDYFSATINPCGFAVEKLPLYPVNGNGGINLVTFEEQKDELFLELPAYLREYYQKRYRQSQKLLKGGSDFTFDRPILANQLQKELPQLFQDDYWLVTPTIRQKAQINSLLCETYIEAGQYHIDLKTNNKLSNVLFMFKPWGGRIFPEIIQPKLMKAKIPSQFYNNRKVYIASVSSEDHLYYIASKEDSAAAFELLWDANKKVMVHLSVASGFCYGNERMNFTRNTLLKYRGNYYLLRSTDNWRYTKVVYFRGNGLQEICHADYTAPEI